MRPYGGGRLARERWANGAIELEVESYQVPGRDDGELDPPNAGLILDHSWLGVGRGARGRGRMLLRTTPAALARVGIGEPHQSNIEFSIKRGRLVAVEAHIEQRLAGVTLATHRGALRGDPLLDALVGAIVEGRKIPPFPHDLIEKVRDSLHWWSLMGSDFPPPPTDARAWLRTRLEAVGFTGLEDLPLLDADDLVPQLEEMSASAGLDPRTLSALREDFPRVWVHRDASYGCAVDLERRKVVLEPLEKKARAAKEPPASVLPRFRGFAVEFQQASRRLRLR